MFPLVLLSVFLAASPEERPTCAVRNLGEIWPPVASRDSEVFLKLSREGEIYTCTKKPWRKFAWERAVVTVEQLRQEWEEKKGKSATAPAVTATAAKPAQTSPVE